MGSTTKLLAMTVTKSTVRGTEADLRIHQR
jgi:hypothetical protein